MAGFFYGVIEGFYGRQWSWEARQAYAAFLSKYGFDCYIYAPKGDSLLRANWRQRHPRREWQQLGSLGQACRRQGLHWGLGFSPLGLSHSYSGADRGHLIDKVRQLNDLNPDILCILFDDSRGDIDGLARRQLDIVSDILSVSSAERHIVCPTYYSFDPILEQVFGNMPEGYLAELGAGIPETTDIFWTGNHVISTRYTYDDLESVSRLLRRKPVLWDNYPVNDGMQTSEYLNLRAYTGRPGALSQWTHGHIVNPMNQPWLSQIVLQSLAAVYQQGPEYDPVAAMEEGLAMLGSPAFAQRLAADSALFQDQGLRAIQQQQRAELIRVYQDFSHPAASEVAQWLAGEYQFDPDCLTS